MDAKELFASLGISTGLGYGLIIQSILVIIAALISLWGIFLPNLGTLPYITNIISLIVCISLLVYSFYGFNAERHQEAFFTTAIVLYIILIIFGLLTATFDTKNPASILTVITLVSTMFFLQDYRKNYKVANFAILVTLISGIIVLIFNMMGGMPWFIALKYIIIPVSIALTYFERIQRGKYDFGI